MPLSRPTVNTIYDRIVTGIEARLTDNVALLRRSVLRILAKVFAGSMHLLYGSIEFISRQIMVDKAEDEYLDRHGFIWGITRKAAAFANGNITFTGVDGTDILEGTLVQTSEGIIYSTNSDTVISGSSGSVDITAEEAGSSGNFDGATLELVSPLDNIDSVISVNAPGISGGVDEEDNDTYRARILQHIQNPPMGGTAEDYVTWAKSDEIPTDNGVVKNAWCFPIASGPGTVDVVITQEGSNPTAPSLLIADVQTYIDSVKPVTADVTVQTVDAQDLVLDISIIPNTSDLQSTITANIQSTIDQVAEPGSDLLISHIRDAIMNAGVDDYKITQITVDAIPRPIDDIEFVDYEYPLLQGINYSLLT